MTGVAEAVVSQLVSAGVRRAYTVPGESFLPLLDACERDPGIQLISTRHESGAAFMAEADAKLTGMPALAMATRAVGAANLAIGVHTAYQDSTPMVVLLGQVESRFLGREAFQEVDLPAFYREITKWSATATSTRRLPELVERALHEATSGRPGPAMVAVPSDLLDGTVGGGDGWRPGVVSVSRPAPDAATVRAMTDVLLGARSPVVIAGGGAQSARAELIAVAERFGLGVYASFRRQDVFPNDHPSYCGHLTLGTPADTLAALEAADVVLVVGARLSEVTTQGYRLPRPDQRLLQIDVEPRVVGAVAKVEVGAVADAAAALAALLAHGPEADVERNWQAAHGALLESSTPPAGDSVPLHPGAVMGAIAGAFPPSVVLTNDAGNFSAFGHRYWRFTEPRTQLGPTSGAMGYAIPAAVAAKFAAPEREVVALCGDGGFLMTGQELEVAVRHQASFTAVVFRNGLYGTIALHQARQLGRTAAVEIGDVDIAAIARGYGAAAWSARTMPELEAALAEARRAGRPAVVDVITDPDVLTPTERLSTLMGKHGT